MNKPYEDIQEQTAQATGGPPQARLTAMHWGVYEAVGSGDALSLRAFARDPSPSPIGLSMPDAARGPLRVLAPFIMHDGAAHMGDAENLTENAQAILRHAAALVLKPAE